MNPTMLEIARHDFDEFVAKVNAIFANGPIPTPLMAYAETLRMSSIGLGPSEFPAAPRPGRRKARRRAARGY
jgi:hypothetical protein